MEALGNRLPQKELHEIHLFLLEVKIWTQKKIEIHLIKHFFSAVGFNWLFFIPSLVMITITNLSTGNV